MQVNPQRIALGIINQDRRYLSRAITLTESTRPEHAQLIGEIIRDAKKMVSEKYKQEYLQLQKETTVSANSHFGNDDFVKIKPRIAITGPPGVGKSSAIEVLGMHLIENLKKSVGVLAVDPSDAERGGSILGDKTRMERLSNNPHAFVRPSPTRGALGGVTARAWEALEVFEAAQFDFTIIETVGVGQSEIEAKNLCDLFVLLVPPLGGDELQGVKRGIVQAADIIVVTKADPGTPQEALAEQACSYHRRAASIMNITAATGDDCTKHPRQTDVLMMSAKANMGVDKLADAISEKFKEREEAGLIHSARQRQRLKHFKTFFEQAVVDVARARLEEQGMYEVFENKVASHRLTPREAGMEALKKIGFDTDYHNVVIERESKSNEKK